MQRTNTLLAALSVLTLVLIFFVFQLNSNVRTYKDIIDSNMGIIDNHNKRLSEIEEVVVGMEQDNERIVHYVNQFYGDDQQKISTLEEVKIALDDHRAKIDSILQTINELH